MNERGAPEIDVERLMGQIREEVTRSHRIAETPVRKAVVGEHLASSGSPLDAGPRPTVSQGATRDAMPEPRKEVPAPVTSGKRATYRFRELTGLHDAAFLRAAYAAILHRTPDPTGEDYYLRMLRGGASKAEVLGRLRYSAEGKAIGTSVKGLAGAYVLDKVARAPVVGGVLRSLVGLWELPDSDRRLRVIENALARGEAHADDRIERARIESERRVRALEDRIARLAELTEERIASAQIGIERRLRGIENETGGLSERVEHQFGSLQIENERRFQAIKSEAARAAMLADQQIESERRVTHDALHDLESRLNLFVGELKEEALEWLENERRAARDALRGVETSLNLLVAELRAQTQERLENDRQASRLAQRDLEGKLGLIADGLTTRATREETELVRRAVRDELVAGLNSVQQSKADQASLAHAKRELEAQFENRIARAMEAIRTLQSQKLDAVRLEGISEKIKAALSDREGGVEAAFDAKLAKVTQEIQAIDANVMREVRSLGAQKLDAASLDLFREETRTAQDHLRTAFEAKLANAMQEIRFVGEDKIDTAGLERLRAEIDAEVQTAHHGLKSAFETTIGNLMQTIQSIDARKLDLVHEQKIREQYQATLRVALEGLTSSVAALAATKVDRDTVNALLLQTSEAILKQVQRTPNRRESSSGMAVEKPTEKRSAVSSPRGRTVSARSKLSSPRAAHKNK